MTPTTESPDEIWIHPETHQYITRPPDNKWWHEQEMVKFSKTENIIKMLEKIRDGMCDDASDYYDGWSNEFRKICDEELLKLKGGANNG